MGLIGLKIWRGELQQVAGGGGGGQGGAEEKGSYLLISFHPELYESSCMTLNWLGNFTLNTEQSFKCVMCQYIHVLIHTLEMRKL